MLTFKWTTASVPCFGHLSDLLDACKPQAAPSRPLGLRIRKLIWAPTQPFDNSFGCSKRKPGGRIFNESSNPFSRVECLKVKSGTRETVRKVLDAQLFINLCTLALVQSVCQDMGARPDGSKHFGSSKYFSGRLESLENLISNSFNSSGSIRVSFNSCLTHPKPLDIYLNHDQHDLTSHFANLVKVRCTILSFSILQRCIHEGKK